MSATVVALAHLFSRHRRGLNSSGKRLTPEERELIEQIEAEIELRHAEMINVLLNHTGAITQN